MSLKRKKTRTLSLTAQPTHWLLKANAQAIQASQAAKAGEYLKALRSPFDGVIGFEDSQVKVSSPKGQWDWDVPLEAQSGELPAPRLVIVLGFGTGRQLRELVQRLPAESMIFVADPFPAITGEILARYACDDLLCRRNFRYFIGSAPEMEQALMQLPPQTLALDKAELYAHPPAWEMVQAQQHPFGPIFKELITQLKKVKAYATREGRMERLETLYQEIGGQMAKAKEDYPFLTCQKGCADCCKGSPGSTIFISPVEWERMFYYLKEEMPLQQQQTLFWKILTFADRHLDDMVSYQKFLTDNYAILFSNDPNNQTLYDLSAHIKLGICPFLDSFNQCQIYNARPMVCRIFGYAYWGTKRVERSPAEIRVVEDRTPYTCHIDREKVKAILQHKETSLFEAHEQYFNISQLHGSYAKGNILPNWLVLHLDLERGAFVAEPRLKVDDFAFLTQPEQTERFRAQVKAYISQHQADLAPFRSQIEFFHGEWF